MKSSRVLVISAHRGLIDRRIVAEINSLAESGREVTLVSVPADIPEHSLHPSVRLEMPASRSPERSHTNSWLRSQLTASARVVLAPLRQWVRARRMRARVRFFLRATPRAAYDAIHCHDLETLPAAEAMRKAVSPAAKLIYDSHELFPYQEKDLSFQRYWSRVENRFIGCADLIIVPNASMAEQMARLYGVQVPAVIFNSYGNPTSAAPLSMDEFQRRFNAPPGGFRVLFQGGLHPLRNLPNLVRAFGQIDPSNRLFIIGTGPLEKQVREICRRQRILNVFFGGFIPQADLLRYTVHADLGMIPYEDAGLLNMRYCSPNKLFEFIEAKIPICASELPELSRIVREHGIGGVYPMNSAEEIAAAIRDCRKRVERGEFTAAAREQARQSYAWCTQAQRLIGLYEQLGA
jgi:glycosyltransferase involved in cell wall biosynthesis